LLSRHLGKHIPGKPQVVMKTMEGAGSLTAANFIYSRAPADGTSLAAVFTGAIVEPLIGDAAKARYDSRKFSYIGSANRETSICYAHKDVGFRDWRDAYEKKLIVGGAGWASSIRQFPAVLNTVLGMKFEIITGYPGSKEAVQAVEKGEVQGTCGIQLSSFMPTNGGWIESGYVKVFGQIAAPGGNAAMNKLGVQNIWDAIKNEDDRKVLELIFNQSDFGRPYIAPPGVPADRLAALREAFDATMKDPEFLAEAAKAQLPIDPMTGAEFSRIVEKLYEVPEPLVARAKKALE
jgi:tripartite-type tricarboxylate transporter receptor subunit TctC